MSHAIRTLILTYMGISLVAMIAANTAGSNTAPRTPEHCIWAESAECHSLAANHDGAEDLLCGKCGDRFCSPQCGETATSCPEDCGGQPSSAGGSVKPTELLCGKCGDGFCNPRCGETETSCPIDCGAST